MRVYLRKHVPKGKHAGPGRGSLKYLSGVVWSDFPSQSDDDVIDFVNWLGDGRYQFIANDGQDQKFKVNGLGFSARLNKAGRVYIPADSETTEIHCPHCYSMGVDDGRDSSEDHVNPSVDGHCEHCYNEGYQDGVVDGMDGVEDGIEGDDEDEAPDDVDDEDDEDEGEDEGESCEGALHRLANPEEVVD